MIQWVKTAKITILLNHRVKPCPHCRRKVRLTQKTATRRIRRVSHFSATVWTGLYSLRLLLRDEPLWIHVDLWCFQPRELVTVPPVPRPLTRGSALDPAVSGKVSGEKPATCKALSTRSRKSETVAQKWDSLFCDSDDWRVMSDDDRVQRGRELRDIRALIKAYAY